MSHTPSYGSEQFRALTGGGIVLAVGGAMMMKGMDDAEGVGGGGTGGGLEEQETSNWGLFVVALGAFTSAVYFIIQKPTLSKYPPITVTAWEYLVCCVFMACAAATWVPSSGAGGADEAVGADGADEAVDRGVWSLTGSAQLALVFSVVWAPLERISLHPESCVYSSNGSLVFGTSHHITSRAGFTPKLSHGESNNSSHYSAVFNSVVKYAVSAFCNKHVGVIVLTVWSTMTPVFTAILSALVLRSPPRWSYLGMVPIVVRPPYLPWKLWKLSTQSSVVNLPAELRSPGMNTSTRTYTYGLT